MKRFQNVIKICLLFMLLCVVAIIPIGITHIQNKKLTEQVYVTDMSEEEQIVYKALKTREKLAVIFNTTKVSVVNDKEVKQSDSDSFDDVIVQLELLKEANILPLIDFKAGAKIENVLKTTYLDIDNPENIVNVKELTLVLQDYDIWVCIDMDTSVIYRIVVAAKEQMPLFKTEFNPLLYMDYLGFPLENVSIKGDGSRGRVIYKDETLQFSYVYNRSDKYLSFELKNSEDAREFYSNPKTITLIEGDVRR
nr:hypothetical protein [uncultured Aminipila sp.]